MLSMLQLLPGFPDTAIRREGQWQKAKAKGLQGYLLRLVGIVFACLALRPR